MSYIGNSPEVNAFTIDVERFSGTGACTEFTLTRDIDDAKAIEVVVGGSQLDPLSAYTVLNGLITFTVAPTAGTDNIVVTYRAPVVVTFNQASSSQIQSGAIGSTQLADNSVTTNKLASGSVTGVKLGESSVSGNNISIKSINASNTITDVSITGNLIGLTAVSGNNIVDNAIRGNNIVAGQITGNLIASGSIRGNNIVAGQITGNLIGTGAITGNLIGSGAISGNQIGAYAISGNQIGIGAVSANNFAGGGITSNVLASNLTISTARISEQINIISSSISGNYDIHLANSTVYVFTANAVGNITFNLIANSAAATGTTGALNDLVVTGNTVSAALIVRIVNNQVKYRANVFIDGVAQQAIWLSNLQPAYYSSGQPNQYEMYNFQVIKVGTTGAGSGGGQYIIFASNAAFGYANGLGMGPSLSQ